MSTPIPDSNLHGKPTPDDLAGTPVTIEEDPPSNHVRGSGRAKVSGPGPTSSAPDLPTADDLAGIPVCAEGEEDLTVRPGRRRRQ